MLGYEAGGAKSGDVAALKNVRPFIYSYIHFIYSYINFIYNFIYSYINFIYSYIVPVYECTGYRCRHVLVYYEYMGC